MSLSRRVGALAALASAPVDLLVVGGGITGAGIARDAALRGFRVALVERDDFGAGTSSRSSRLVHGGLRYLEHGHLRLVFEASAERRRLLNLAPHLVRPLAFTWPVYEGARVPRWKLTAGLLLYDTLSLFRNVQPHERLDAAEVLEREPALHAEGLLGGARYYDAATDDSRLTLANALGAAAAGAIVLNHAEVRRLTMRDDAVTGAVVLDTLGGSEVAVAAKVVVNATGPWADRVRRLEDPEAPAAISGSKGVHVALPRERVGNRGALTLLSPLDGRVMFVLPSGAQTIIGTTDTVTQVEPDQVRAAEADVEYLLRSVNAFFPEAELEREDVVSAWAGIRPLVAGYRTGPVAASREHAIFWSRRGLLGVSGGKLTTYRVMAAQVVDAAAVRLGSAPARTSPTRDAPLPGGEIDSLAEETRLAAEKVGDPLLADHLVRSHGSAWRLVWAHVERQRELAEPVVAGLPWIRAELVYAVEEEMACTLADLLIRRTRIAFEVRDHGRAAAPAVASLVAPLLDWSRQDAERAVAEYAREVERMFGVDPAR